MLYSLILFSCFVNPTRSESIGEKIFRKIATGLKKRVMKVKTCGLPRINNIMRNLTLNPGDTASFRCSVDMKCMVSYIQWYHESRNGSVRLLRTGATQGTPYRYTVRNVNPQDAGFYSCVAGNILGETVKTAFLKVNSAPPSEERIFQTFLLLFIHALVINHIVR